MGDRWLKKVSLRYELILLAFMNKFEGKVMERKFHWQPLT